MSMIEKAARALCVFRGEDPDALEPGDDPYRNNTSVIDGYNRKGEPCHFYWRQYEDQARAVLEAIREPSEEMVEAGINQVRECTDDWSASAACSAEHAWRAMIDAILSDTAGEG